MKTVPLLEDPDPEMRKLAREEIEALDAQLEKVADELKYCFFPRIPTTKKIFCLKSGPAPEEMRRPFLRRTSFRMYTRYAELRTLEDGSPVPEYDRHRWP
jgi:peptide chain release factor 1